MSNPNEETSRTEEKKTNPGTTNNATYPVDPPFHGFNSVDINTLFKFIKPFDGDREKLIPVLNNCDAAFGLASEEQSNILFAYIKSQLSGKAETACSNHVFRTWDSLKDYLKNMYSDKKHQGHLLMELLGCKQFPNETIPQFMCKLETCLKRVLTSIQQSNHNQVELPGRLAAMNDLALHTFILNVKPQISQMLRAREINTLNEAFNIALEEEKVLLLLHQQTQKSKFCQNCKTVGHSTLTCYKKPVKRETVSIEKPIKPIILQTSAPKVCKYCKKKGHDISECRKRIYVNQRRAQQGNQGNVNQGNIQSVEVTAATPLRSEQFAATILN